MTHKFKVGDKVRRNIQNRYVQSGGIGYTDVILTIEHIRADGSLKFVEDSSIIHFCPEYYELMACSEPDLKSFPWMIVFNSRQEGLAAYEWIKARGYDFSHTGAQNIGSQGFFTNVYNGCGIINKTLLVSNTLPQCKDTLRYEILLTLEVKISRAEFPVIEPKKTEKQLEIESIRRDQEALAARLKKLETE